MAIINSFFSWIMKKRIHQIELFIKYPIDVQEELLRKLLATAKHTELGKFFDYNSIKNVEEFRNRVPVQNYETHKPYIKRLMLGEQNLLWPTEVKWFAKSSGTTSDKSKFIPVTAESMEECHFKGGKDLLSIYFNNHPESNLFSGRFLTLGGSHQINSFSNESFYGDLSAIIMQNLPFWMELFRTPDLSVALMDEWEDKIRKIADITIREDVTSISGVPSWMLVLMKYILEITGKENLLQIWPNLELFVHGAVSFKPYENQFQKLIPKGTMNYVETYNASEGFFGIQDVPNSDDMLLMLDYGIYYEFIEDHHLGFDHNKAISLSAVELDKNYALLITTNGGLWRYQIGDTITFTSLSPHRIKITGRTAHFINAFGEEVIVDNAEKAIASACLRTNAVLRDYTAAPIYFSDATSGGHEWLIEFETHPSSTDEFVYYLDQKLKELNSDYEAKRYHDKVLCMPLVRIVNDGTFYNWLKSKDKLGGQHKVPRLSNNRKIVDEILQMMTH